MSRISLHWHSSSSHWKLHCCCVRHGVSVGRCPTSFFYTWLDVGQNRLRQDAKYFMHGFSCRLWHFELSGKGYAERLRLWMARLVSAEIQPQRHRGDCKLQKEKSALLVAHNPKCNHLFLAGSLIQTPLCSHLRLGIPLNPEHHLQLSTNALKTSICCSICDTKVIIKETRFFTMVSVLTSSGIRAV
jgi:hypothetical protein